MVSFQLACTFTSAPAAIPPSFVLSAEVIIAPEPAEVTSDSSVTPCRVKLVRSDGLFCINASLPVLASFQLDCTLTSADAAIPFNLVSKAVVKSSVDKPLPTSVFCLASKAA